MSVLIDVYEVADKMRQLERDRDELIAKRSEAPHDSDLWNYGYEEIAYMQADIDGYREEIEDHYLSQPSEARFTKDNCVYELFFADVLGYYMVTENKRVIGIFECAEVDALKNFRKVVDEEA